MKTITLLLLLFTGTLFAQPNINQPNDILVCDDDSDGFVAFDLTVNENQTLNGLNPTLYTISYYVTLLDSQAEINPIANATSYVNTTNPQTIYIRVSENADPSNFALESFDLIVNQPPAIVQPPNITVYEDPNDGFAEFDLTSIHDVILNGQNPANFLISHYETVADAQNDVGAIVNPTTYINIVSGIQTLYLSVLDVINGCRIVDSYNIIVQDAIVFIPDTNFKSKLLQANAANFIAKNLSDDYFKIDANDDGEIQYVEASQVSYLNVQSSNIFDMQGLEAIVNIDSLRVSFNSFTSINLANNTGLKYLECIAVPLTSIDLTNNLDLEFLQCQNNQLTAIDVSNNLNLNYLNCGYNQLGSLDVTLNTNLQTLLASNNQLSVLDLTNNNLMEVLSVGFNQISTLDVSMMPNLMQLYTNNNMLTSIDVTNNGALTSFSCGSNQLTVLDVTNNALLESLVFSDNQIQTIDLTNNDEILQLYCNDNLIDELDLSGMQNLSWAYLQDNPNLTYVNIKNGNNDNYLTGEGPFVNLPSLSFVCVDDGGSDFASAIAAQIGNPVVITDYCTFVPGGDYNTITGTIQFDSQNDGCDASDDVFPFVKININDGTESGSTFTDINANYTFYTQEGNFLITPDIENPSFFNVSPTEVTINFLTADNGVATQDFCITADGIHPDLEIAIAPILPARPGFDAKYLITYKNKGNQTLSGDVSLSYSSEVLDYVISSETPASQTGTIINWTFLDLLPFESRRIEVTFNVNSPTETPAVNIGDILNFIVNINPVAGDESVEDNIFDYNQTVVGSYDPNDITCLQGDVVAPTEIGNYLHYIINFENTGTAAAENVVVKVEIDPAMFDVNSLRLLSASHDAEVKVTNNIVEIIFETITLESGGHGNILLKMLTKSDLAVNSTVTENAEIFFDYNFPILTNDANTTFAVLSVSEFEIDKNVKIYPNPVRDFLSIQSKNVIKNVSLYDVQGRLVLSKIISGIETKVDVSTQSDGVYFLKITTEQGVHLEKIIKN